MAIENVMRINGTPVAVHSSYRRDVRDDAGIDLAEFELVVLIRGRMTNKQFIQHMSSDRIRLELKEGGGVGTYFMWITNHTSAASGSGESTIYRHDITMREDPDGANQRHALAAQNAPEPVAVAVAAPVAVIEAPGEISDVRVATTAASWGDAIRQMKGEPMVAKIAELPLSPQELLAIEIVLTNLRIDAMLDQMEGASLLKRSSVNARFRVLIEDRFVEEATPLIGEQAAKRAMKDI